MTLTTAEMRAAIVAQRQGPPKCERCGGPVWTPELCQRHRAMRDRAELRGLDISKWKARWIECRVCRVVLHGGVQVGDEGVWPDIEHYYVQKHWRGREQEANVPETRVSITWAEETFPDGHPPVFYADTFDDVTLAALERSHRPRAIVEVGPEPGSDEVTMCLTSVMIQMAMAEGHNGTMGRGALGAAANLRVGHTFRDVPAYTEVDRYDPQTGEPTKAKFLRGVLVRPGRLATAEEMLALLDEYGRKVGEAMAAQPSFLWSGPPIDEDAEEARVEQALGFTPGD